MRESEEREQAMNLLKETIIIIMIKLEEYYIERKRGNGEGKRWSEGEFIKYLC